MTFPKHSVLQIVDFLLFLVLLGLLLELHLVLGLPLLIEPELLGRSKARSRKRCKLT
jgi:hypothetical protein